jgi:hypothetical protein
LFHSQALVVAVACDRHAIDQLHGEVRPALSRGARVENTRDVWVIHHRQRLPLALEARDHLAAVHPGLDDLERHVPAKWVRLLSVVDHAHAAFPDRLYQLVGTICDENEMPEAPTAMVAVAAVCAFSSSSASSSSRRSAPHACRT